MIELQTPGIGTVGAVVGALRAWQRDDAPMQLHPGDIGWAWQSGAEATAASLRTWSRGGEIVAVGMLDRPNLLRVTVSPEAWRDDELAHRVVEDLADAGRGVLPAGQAGVESPDTTLVQQLLTEFGWTLDEPWRPLRRDLADPVETTALQIEVVGPEQVAEYTAVHRSSFGSARFTDALWHTLAAGPVFAEARSLLGRDDDGVAVAEVTVWSAGPGRPGLLEPMGVHAEHHGHGHGRAICLAAAAELQRMGASSALVCTPSARTAAVATYASAGFRRMPERLDRARTA